MADNIFIPDVGLTRKLDVLRSQLFEALTIRLYKSDTVPAAGDTVLTYQECDFSGYAPKNMTPWDAVAINAGVASTHIGPFVWSHNGGAVGNNVYGWFAIDNGGKLIFASRRAAGFIVMNGINQSYSVDVVTTDERA